MTAYALQTRKIITALAVGVMLSACSNLNKTEQRVLSGSAIGAGAGAVTTVMTGGCVGCGAAIGAAVGAGTGYAYDLLENGR